MDAIVEHSTTTISSSLSPADISVAVPVKVVNRIQVFRSISSKVPLNDYGLPKLVYRPDLIPEDLFYKDDQEKAQLLDIASVEILYREGFPTFEDGASFWSQMPFEPDDSYFAFQKYMDLGNTQGVRRLEALYEQNSGEHVGNPLALSEFFTYYTWGPRCKAFDLFSAAAYQKLRERRVQSTTNQHFLEAERLLTVVKGYFEKVSEETGELEFLEELTPKVALDMLTKLVQIQRISLGIPAHGLSGGEAGVAPPNAEVSVVLKTIAKAGLDPEASQSNLGSYDIEMILGDPETATLAQQLIVQIGRSNAEGD